MKKHNAAFLMLGLALVMAVFHILFGWYRYVTQSELEGIEYSVAAYALTWVVTFFEVMQGEFFGLFVELIVLAGVLGALGFYTYEEDQDKIEATQDRILDRLDRIDYTLGREINK